MTITLELYELKNLIMEMSELGVLNYTKTIEPKSDLISQQQAFERFGRRKVQRWIDNSLINHVRNGSEKNSKKNYSYTELIAVAKSEKLIGKIK